MSYPVYDFTAKVDSHHTNPNYKCLLLNLLPLPEFHFKAVVRDEHGRILKNVSVELVKADLIPTYEWMIEANKLMCRWKPEYVRMLTNAVLMGDFEK